MVPSSKKHVRMLSYWQFSCLISGTCQVLEFGKNSNYPKLLKKCHREFGKLT